MRLLAERATEGLDSARSAELEKLLSRHPELADETLELAAAAIDRALTGPAETLPDGLRSRLMATAAGFHATRDSSERRDRASGGTTPTREAPADIVELRRGPQIATWGGWLAAAAALILAALAWWPDLPANEAAPVILSAEATPAEARAALLAEADDLVRIDWTATEDPAAGSAGGDVAWSPSRQTGFMRFAGLEPNDPAREQYQLWVFDAARDERYPVDGGVFDIPSESGEIIVPITTRLPVKEATFFAVTVEPPGGVVVSDRSRIVRVASPAG